MELAMKEPSPERTAREVIRDAILTATRGPLPNAASQVLAELELAGFLSRDVYVALRDTAGETSQLVGAFSTEEKARAACQEDRDENGEPGPLAWNSTTACGNDGDLYDVVLTELNSPL
jgi:hypothetical protein